MTTVKDLITCTVHSSPDGQHWEPALPQCSLWGICLRDAWAVLNGKATAIRQTTKDDLGIKEKK